MNDDVLNKVEKKTNVKKETIINLAKKLSNGNMKDESTIRDVIEALSKATGKNVDESVKEKIINTIKEDKVPGTIEKMF